MSLLNPDENEQTYQSISGNNNRNDNKKRKLLVIIIPIAVVIVISIIGIILYSKNTNVSLISKLTNNNEDSNGVLNIGQENEVEQLTNEVKKIMLLPDETPILATVSDLDKVKSQTFFTKAEVGDKVLIFMQARKAILYRPSDKLIIEVGFVNDQTGGEVAGENISVPETTPVPETTDFLPKTTPTINPSPTPTPKAVPTIDFSSEY